MFKNQTKMQNNEVLCGRHIAEEVTGQTDGVLYFGEKFANNLYSIRPECCTREFPQQNNDESIPILSVEFPVRGLLADLDLNTYP